MLFSSLFTSFPWISIRVVVTEAHTKQTRKVLKAPLLGPSAWAVLVFPLVLSTVLHLVPHPIPSLTFSFYHSTTPHPPRPFCFCTISDNAPWAPALTHLANMYVIILKQLLKRQSHFNIICNFITCHECGTEQQQLQKKTMNC